MNTINEEDKENELVQISRGELNRRTKRDAEVERLRKENEKLNLIIVTKDGEMEGLIDIHHEQCKELEDQLTALKKQLEELKQPLTDDERKELERLRNKQADPTYPMTQEQFDRLHLLSNKQWGNAPKELAALKKQAEEMKPESEYVPYQRCPICNGKLYPLT